MYITDDPVSDYDRYDAEHAIQLERLPRCICCGEHIQQETVVCINDELLCDTCITEYFRKPIEDYTE